jgi:RNA polymerase sigma-70 factor, ECF subfamily
MTGEPEPDAGGANAPADDARLRADALFSLAYEELRRLASVLRRSERSHTLQTTALVHEAWLKLAGTPDIGAADELHFKRVAVRAMRQVLIDAARRRNAGKRDGAVVTLDDQHAGTGGRAEWLIALDDALTRLARLNARQAQMVEARFFGGLDVLETARLLGVSEATVMRDWRMARAWLAGELSGDHLPP